MKVALQLTSEEEAALTVQAQARGLSLEGFVENLVKQAAANAHAHAEPDQKQSSASLLGLLAKYGRAPSAEEIDHNRFEMFGSFVRD